MIANQKLRKNQNSFDVFFFKLTFFKGLFPKIFEKKCLEPLNPCILTNVQNCVTMASYHQLFDTMQC